MPVLDYPLTTITYPGTSFIVMYTDGYKSWSRTPGYGSIAGWDLPVNPYSHSRWTGTGCQPVYATNVRKSDGFVSQSGPYGITGVAAHSHDLIFDDLVNSSGIQSEVSVRNELIINALIKASDMKINLAVSLAESAKTAELILGKARQISSAYFALRRGDLRKVASLLNITPSKIHRNWLEYKYGWMPLLMDVKGAAEHLARQNLGPRLPRFSVSSSKTVESSPKRVIATSYSTGAVGTETWSVSYQRRQSIKLWFEVANPNLLNASSLGLTNPALVAWELVPFSFVFDWFISVGNYLQAVTAMHGLSLHKASHSVKTTKSGTYTYSSTPGQDSSWFYGGVAVNYKLSPFASFNRTIPVVDPLSIYPPVNTSAFSWQKMITSLALLRSQSRPSNLRV